MYVVREAPGGLTTLAYLAGRMTWDLVLLPLYPAVFLMSFYATTAFSTPWPDFYGIMFQASGGCRACRVGPLGGRCTVQRRLRTSCPVSAARVLTGFSHSCPCRAAALVRRWPSTPRAWGT